jgi:hypothetical protein
MHVSHRLLRTPGAVARMAAVVVVAAGVLAGSGQAPAARAAGAALGYSCTFPSGTQRAAVQVAATFPASARTGFPVRPSGVKVTVTMPQGIAADLASMHAATVAATADLSVTVTQNGAASGTAWAGLKASPAPVPGSGPLVLAAAGPVSPMIAEVPGTMAFIAGAVTLVLTPRTPGGRATSPAAIHVTCTPGPGQPTRLGTVLVRSPAAASAKPGASTMASRGTIMVGAGTARHGIEAQDIPAAPPIDPIGYQTCFPYTNDGPNTQPGYGQGRVYVGGFSDAAKLGGAAVLGYPRPALVESEGPNEAFHDVGSDSTGGIYDCETFAGELDYPQRAFPPAQATFLAFGFMPVTATATITQVGQQPVRVVEYNPNMTETTHCVPCTIVSIAEVSLSISKVRVNGVPLDVGSNCHTVRPLYTPDPTGKIDPNNDLVVMTGGTAPGNPQPWDAGPDGGSLAGTATIPPFTGCVTPGGDNLDPLLDASVSGPGNYVKVTSGIVCNTANPTSQLACTPNLLPITIPQWTVTHGAKTFTGTATGPLTFTWRLNPRNFVTITCPNPSPITGALPDTTGVPRGDLGTVSGIGGSGCTGDVVLVRQQQPPSTWTVTQQGTGYFDGVTYDPSTGTTDGVLNNLTFDVTETSGPYTDCTEELSGEVEAPGLTGEAPGLAGGEEMTYANPPASTLSLTGQQGYAIGLAGTSPDSGLSPPQGCPAPMAAINTPAGGLQVNYRLSPSTITITSPVPPG